MKSGLPPLKHPTMHFMRNDRNTALEIITPSYRPDFELCVDLADSVRQYGRGTSHRIIVPTSDRALFGQLENDHCTVSEVGDILPRHLHKVVGRNVWVNSRAPWPPVRGWIAQQLVKLAAAAASTADYVLLVDSDVVFVRPFSAATYTGEDATRVTLYRKDNAVHAEMRRHLQWDAVARTLLGLPADSSPIKHDYICCPCLWRTDLVRAMLDVVSRTTGTHWATAIGRQLHFSEMVLYGVYADAVSPDFAEIDRTDNMHCANHYDETPLNDARMSALLASATGDDVAIMVSAKSGTSLDVRRRHIKAFKG